MKKTKKADKSANTETINKMIKLCKNVDKVANTLKQIIIADIETNGGQLICLTAQKLFNDGETFKSTTLNTLQRAVVRTTRDQDNGLQAVRIVRDKKNDNACELMANDKAEKSFSTFDEIIKLIERTEGKTANNLDKGQMQTLIQILGENA